MGVVGEFFGALKGMGQDVLSGAKGSLSGAKGSLSGAKGYGRIAANKAVIGIDSGLNKATGYYNSHVAQEARAISSEIGKEFSKGVRGSKFAMGGGALVGGAYNYHESNGNIRSTIKGAAFGAGTVGLARGLRATVPSFRLHGGTIAGGLRSKVASGWSGMVSRARSGA